MSHRQVLTKNEKKTRFHFLAGSKRFSDDFKKIIFLHVFENVRFFENLEQSIKSDVSDANGPRKCDFHEETIQIGTGETDFRSTVTHFMNFSKFHYFSYFFRFLLKTIRFYQGS